jgi:hypothetical protein
VCAPLYVWGCDNSAATHDPRPKEKAEKQPTTEGKQKNNPRPKESRKTTESLNENGLSARGQPHTQQQVVGWKKGSQRKKKAIIDDSTVALWRSRFKMRMPIPVVVCGVWCAIAEGKIRKKGQRISLQLLVRVHFPCVWVAVRRVRRTFRRTTERHAKTRKVYTLVRRRML